MRLVGRIESRKDKRVQHQEWGKNILDEVYFKLKRTYVLISTEAFGNPDESDNFLESNKSQKLAQKKSQKNNNHMRNIKSHDNSTLLKCTKVRKFTVLNVLQNIQQIQNSM